MTKSANLSFPASGIWRMRRASTSSRLRLRFSDKNERGLVLVLGEMAIHAVVTHIEFSVHEPLPERRIAGIQGRLPILVPGQHVGIFPVTFREILFAKTFHHRDRKSTRLN